MQGASLRKEIRDAAPVLAKQVDLLCEQWLAGLFSRLADDPSQFRSKQLNDPIWGTIELLPREVALLDSKLLQRMRGVRQLGLAQLVFSGAAHDRLEHIMGVVGAVERMVDALERQIVRWNSDCKRRGVAAETIPPIDEDDRQALRLAAMFHDLGHGPFSHAIEPVLDVNSPLGSIANDAENGAWRVDLKTARNFLTTKYSLNGGPATSEVIAVMMVASKPVTKLFEQPLFHVGGLSANGLQERIIAAIIGGVEGPGAYHLSSVISGQVDADRLDFLSRDAHHCGLNIGFDTERLLSKLEVIQVRDNNLESADEALRDRIGRSPNAVFHQVGIAASGYGSLEQMLIGRTFLYDRLYHHHKVRAAEAMAQRMLLVAERDRGRRFNLDEIFLAVGDDTFIRACAEEITHPKLEIASSYAVGLARGILDRELLHRAFAFRGRFIAAPPGLDSRAADANRDAQWQGILRGLGDLQARYDLGAEIYSVAVAISEVLSQANIDTPYFEKILTALGSCGAEQVIIDLPGRKAGAIRILARYPDGSLKLPEFSFNPQKWADAYDLQKRTGYVFCPKDVVPIIAIASRVVFLRQFGVVMSRDADAYIKAGRSIDQSWIDALVAADLLDSETVSLLSGDRHSLLRVRTEDLVVPQPWLGDDPDFASRLAAKLNKYLKGGLTVEGRAALTKALAAIWKFVDSWYAGPRTTQSLASEAELQALLLEHLRMTLDVDEGTEIAGGELDLLVEKQVVVENKFHSKPANAETVAKGAGMQGRRYGLALNSQLVIVVAARKVPPRGVVPNKTDAVTVQQIASQDRNRVEIRIDLPFGASLPSGEKAES